MLELPRDYNAAVDLVGRNAGRGAKVAYIDDSGSCTYAELAERVDRAANALLAMELRREDRIGIAMLDSADWVALFLGAIKAGIVPVAMNTLLTPKDYEYQLRDSRSRAVFVSEPLLKSFEGIHCPDLRHVVPHSRLKELLSSSGGKAEAAPTTRDDICFWLYSSGSTGAPKGTVHLHSHLIYTAELYAKPILGIRESDVVFSAAKLSFSYGLGNAMAFPMSVGASAILLPERPTPQAVLDTIRRHRPTVFYAVPSLYAALLAHPEIGAGAGSDRLRLCISAGEPLPANLGERWRATVGVDVLDGIGSTEMLQTFLSNRPDDVRYGSTGRPVPGYDVKIVDENGHELPDGQIGELIVRGPSAGEGYWNQRAKSRRTFAGEWTYTGDKYVRDQDGYYYYCGRTDDMFKVNGMWVSPFEVEAALVSHEAVLEAAVVGKEDGDGLIKPKAFIVLKNGYGADERLFEMLRAHVKERAGAWKYPRWIDVRPDLPRTATGKIQRFKLRD